MSEARFAPGARVGVLLPMPFGEPLDYTVPEGITLAAGDFVSVELGARQTVGVVWGPGGQPGTRAIARSRLKQVTTRLVTPPLSGTMRRFLGRAADYTMTPLGMMLRLATRVPDLGAPPKTVTRWHLGPAWPRTRPEKMTPARRRVVAVLEQHGGLGFAAAELARLAGVTSSVIKGLAAAGAASILRPSTSSG